MLGRRRSSVLGRRRSSVAHEVAETIGSTIDAIGSTGSSAMGAVKKRMEFMKKRVNPWTRVGGGSSAKDERGKEDKPANGVTISGGARSLKVVAANKAARSFLSGPKVQPELKYQATIGDA